MRIEANQSIGLPRTPDRPAPTPPPTSVSPLQEVAGQPMVDVSQITPGEAVNIMLQGERGRIATITDRQTRWQTAEKVGQEAGRLQHELYVALATNDTSKAQAITSEMVRRGIPTTHFVDKRV